MVRRKDVSICNFCDRPLCECSFMLTSKPIPNSEWYVKYYSHNGKRLKMYKMIRCPLYTNDDVRKGLEEMVNSRDKGARGERELANILKTYGFKCRRGQQYQGGADSPDVIGLPNIHIECKRVEKLNVGKALLQAIRDCGEDEFPAVFHRRNGEDWMVTMALDDWVKLYRGEANESKPKDR